MFFGTAFCTYETLHNRLHRVATSEHAITSDFQSSKHPWHASCPSLIYNQIHAASVFTCLVTTGSTGVKGQEGEMGEAGRGFCFQLNLLVINLVESVSLQKRGSKLRNLLKKSNNSQLQPHHHATFKSPLIPREYHYTYQKYCYTSIVPGLDYIDWTKSEETSAKIVLLTYSDSLIGLNFV